MKYFFTLVVCLICSLSFSQIIYNEAVNSKKSQDSIKKEELLKYIGNGYFPTKYFDFDLRYLIKYNQYEGFRTGLGGVTNSNFSDKFRIEGYGVYGFLDKAFKYSLGFGLRLHKKTNTWINASYTKDLVETGNSTFLTDGRLFQFFEPRLLNIELFHNTRVKKISFEHQFTPKILTETEFSSSKINPTYNYVFNTDDLQFTSYNLSMAIVSIQWSPFSSYKIIDNNYKEVNIGFPKISLQYSKSFKSVLEGDFNFSKVDIKIQQLFNYKNETKTLIEAKGGLANGDLPLSHSYHSYPNNVNKETIMQRFSVAGINSFETMFFNEFYSDRFLFLQGKHFINPFNISPWFKPQLVLITRFTIGDMSNIEKHQFINFDTLDKGYFESGFEINKLLYGFGLSFAYRYGAYHLPEFQDNLAFKFTFNINLNK